MQIKAFLRARPAASGSRQQRSSSNPHQQQQHAAARPQRARRRGPAAAQATGNGHHSSSNGSSLGTAASSSSGSADFTDEDSIWRQLAFPSYMQSRAQHKPQVCRDFDKAVTAAERRQSRGALGLEASTVEEEEEEDDLEPETVWHTIRREAERDAAAEPLLSSFLYASILAHDSFERALAFVLSNRLANAVMLPTQLFEIFHEVLVKEPDVREGALADVEACRERDPACTSYSQALLYYKGYHAIQTHRIAHALWQRGQKVMATALQSRMSEVLAVDIHPAARMGRGILLDHGTGVVIGETAVIGNNVSLLQNVTLGGTGKEHGDRHPKISDNVLIGACATVLGSIRVGEGAQIAAGSLVLKPVAAHTMVAGSPAKVVGHVSGNPAVKMQQWSKKLLNWDPFSDTPQQPQQGRRAPSPQQPQPQQQEQAPAPPAQQQEQQQQLSLPASLPRPTKLSVAASEAAWDALAARLTAGSGGSRAPAGSSGGGSSSSSSRAARAVAGAPQARPDMRFHVHTNGHANGSSNGVAARLAAAAQAGLHVVAPPHHGGSSSNSAAPATPTKRDDGAPGLAAAGRKEAAAELRGLHEGDVEATIDESVAADWSARIDEPEYVI